MLSTRNTLVEGAYPVAALVVLTSALSATLFSKIPTGTLTIRTLSFAMAAVGFGQQQVDLVLLLPRKRLLGSIQRFPRFGFILLCA